jgi:hypothetical protein
MSLHKVLLGRALATEVSEYGKVHSCMYHQVEALGQHFGLLCCHGSPWANDEIFDSVCMYVCVFM